MIFPIKSDEKFCNRLCFNDKMPIFVKDCFPIMILYKHLPLKPNCTALVRLLVLWFMLLVAAPARAELHNAQFRYYSASDGLSNSHITDIVQDGRGYIWVGTTDGLNRFDGYQFKVFRHDPFDENTIGGNNIRCLYEDHLGKIWIGLLNGIVSCFDPHKEQFTNFNCIVTQEGQLTDGDISGIVEDNAGILWIAVDRHGFIRLNPANGDIVRYEANPHDPNSLSHNATTSIAIGRDNCVWLTTWGGGVNRFDPATGNFTHYTHLSTEPGDRSFLELECQFHDSEGRIWVGSDNSGVYCFDAQMQYCRHYRSVSANPAHRLTHDTVFDITEGADGKIYVATYGGGINVLNPSLERFDYILPHEDESSLKTNLITALLFDRAGSLWVGTRNGLQITNFEMVRFNKYDLRRWDSQSTDSYIFSVLKLRNGDILFKGLRDMMRLDKSTGEAVPVYYAYNKGERVSVVSMMEDSQGCLWFGTLSNYVVRYNPATGRRERIVFPDPPSGFTPFRNVRSFFEDVDGSIWMASEIGVMHFEPASRKFTPLFQSHELIYPEEKATAILRDSWGELWVSTEGGLKHYDQFGSLLEHYIAGSGPRSLSDNAVTAIHEDRSKTLWIGTRGGLHRFNRENRTFTLIRCEDGIINYPVMGIVEDDNRQLWISSTAGIIRYDYAADTFQIYEESDGLQSREFNQGVFSQGTDGEIVFGGINGFNTFYPDAILQNSAVPPVYITDFMVFNQSIATGVGDVREESVGEIREIVLKHWQSMLSFQFVALDYLSPERNKYAYRLEGLDNDWNYTDAERRFATYTNLRPGKYIFSVKAANNDGIWNEAGASVRITILPPVWKTWWAYTIYTGICIALFLLTLRYVARREQTKARIEMERLEAKRQHEADEQKLQFFTNVSHEFRTSLTLIQGPLDYIRSHNAANDNRPMLEIMYRNTSRLKRLINQLLDFRKNEAGKLSVNLITEDIIPLLREVFDIYRFYAEQRNITFTFTTAFERKEMDIDPDKTDKILYNLLSNAFNYTEDGGTISVTVDETEDAGSKFLSIRVADNGAGIPAEALQKLFTLFYQVNDKQRRYRGGSGLGLNMTRELVSLLGGRITVESEVGQGSVFTVYIPIANTGIQAQLPQHTATPVLFDANPAKAQTDDGEDKRGIILIVEDNSDMRLYIKQVLASPEFRILEAPNGEVGFRMVVEHIPDIIVSDIMMPVMDGMELLCRVRQDERVNHIPMILLTAINEEQQIVRSFEDGVDDYIPKPFSAPVLRMRVHNILQMRRKLWERYASMHNVPQTEATSYETKYVNPFVTKLTEIVSQNIAVPEFGVDSLASECCMSASQLTRKCRSLMNDTPYNFIIKTRMEYAAALIRHSDKSVSEIAWECGYTEKSNFSRAFAKHFGKSPTQYKKES